MAKFYSGTGDDGKTGYLGEGRLEKFDLRMETLGSLDELSAALGVARSWMPNTPEGETVISIQRRLYELMAEVAASPENAKKFRHITAEVISELEVLTDHYSMSVESPKGFIVPGQTQASAAISLARAIARRAERRVAELMKQGAISNPTLLGYLNRLSSFLFVLEIKLINDKDGGVINMARVEKK